MNVNTNAPSSTVKAAGIGGLLAGVPIGAYLGNLVTGLIAYAWPGAYEAMSSAADVKTAIIGIFTVAVTVAFGYYKKEKVLK